jgi:hypothetical protein
MSTKQLKNFIEFVNSGGRLVWEGDAGTKLTKDDNFLFKDEKWGESEKHEIIGPWARKEGENIIAFDEVLGVNFKANFCDIKNCTSAFPKIGLLNAPGSNEHRLIKGLQPGFELHGNFSIVEQSFNGSGTIVLAVDTLSDIIGNDGINYGNSFPIIVTSGFGERVAYYAIPLENLAHPEQQKKSFVLLENMYYGMLR